MMTINSLINILQKKFPGLLVVNTWGETSLFYNPGGLLKHGTYCFTFKEKDGENDSASKLDRNGINYRLNFKINKPSFLTYFNEPCLPKIPAKGGVITLTNDKDYCPSEVNVLFPHPVYAWMGWVSIIDPDKKTIDKIISAGLMDESYNDAISRYKKNPKVRLVQNYNIQY